MILGSKFRVCLFEPTIQRRREPLIHRSGVDLPQALLLPLIFFPPSKRIHGTGYIPPWLNILKRRLTAIRLRTQPPLHFFCCTRRRLTQPLGCPLDQFPCAPRYALDRIADLPSPAPIHRPFDRDDDRFSRLPVGGVDGDDDRVGLLVLLVFPPAVSGTLPRANLIPRLHVGLLRPSNR
jgi:hypothetical protein